ncbi:MAG: MbtH family protein [Bacillaceae bacterium]|jgi:MbtH protein|uniref:Protein mbtH n=1 Tax=Aeribacillus pallidus TaxID=33936 RepID=A0A165XXM1_9BACI|nr:MULTISPECIES: MbtH family protein [Aeribacillus]REJ13864.1 MAG: MbtH family protein [Bacillaceae bacterium]KZM56093.1 protein mbtH [Aeribacillus pallidus]KZN96512.1 protein mbtH [Aeribacillus pallidus]MDR9797164.1 MbtH family protein [Aeribacillus pallidus]MED0651570.1 MbtH family protein [Aeribacillus composti]
MKNPFENEQLSFFVLVNEEEQFSLWPAPIDVPAGWRIVFGEDTRANCLAYIQSHWTDMRPASLKQQTHGIVK